MHRYPTRSTEIRLLFSFLFVFLLVVDLCSQNLLRQPESVVFDASRNRYLVSNKETGEIIAIAGSGAQTRFKEGLGSCRGVEIVGSELFVACDLGVVGMDLATGTTTMTVAIPGMEFLNDLTADSSGVLYASDSNVGKIFSVSIDHETHAEVAQGLSGPNGLLFDEASHRLLVCEWPAPGRIQAIDLQTRVVTTIKTTNLDPLDGLAVDEDGRIYVSSFGGNTVYRYDASLNGVPEVVSSGHSGPADIYYNPWLDELAVPNFNANRLDFIPIEQSSVERERSFSPATPLLMTNYPNPFNGSTILRYTLDRPARVEVSCYDLLGYRVRCLSPRHDADEGHHHVRWDGEDERGMDVPSGFYFFRVIMEDRAFTHRILLIR